MMRRFLSRGFGRGLWAGIVLLLATILPGRADVLLAPLFRDGVVLQRDKPLPVWGWAEPGEAVAVRLGLEQARAVADAAGRWRVMLPPRPASATPVKLVAEGRNRVVVQDVVVGEVWLCSGQSNMMMVARNARDAEAEALTANFPLIRQFKVASRFESTPQDTVAGGWEACSPATFGNFSAVAIFFARELWRELGVPVGIVNASYGNTPIASWRTPGGVAAEPVVTRWWSEQQKHQPPPRPHREPSACYNGMVHPLEPYAFRGVLWYQGESDATDAATLAPIYSRQFAGLIAEWRRRFEQPDLPFFWVQLAGFGKAGPRGYVALREQQAATLTVANTGQAIAIDVGDPTDIHPKNKQAVGDRLARLALHRVYGRAIEDSGPEPVAVTREGAAVRLRFAHAGGGLSVRGDLRSLFELAGADGRFVPASDAKIEGDAILIRADAVAEPRRVRFSYQDLPSGAVYNGAGLPAGPFSREIPGASELYDRGRRDARVPSAVQAPDCSVTGSAGLRPASDSWGDSSLPSHLRRFHSLVSARP